jgi:hypothetical protein
MSKQEKDAPDKGVRCEPPQLRVAPHTCLTASTTHGSGGHQAVRPDDPVNHPAHYTHGGVEFIDAIRSMLGEEGYRDFLRGTIVKYQWRMRHKGNMAQDAAKAKWYSDRLAESLAKAGV